MIRIQKVERENRPGTEHRRRVPVKAQKLSKVLEEPILRTIAETDIDIVITGKVNDQYPLSFGRKGAAVPRVSKVYDQSEALEGYALEKTVRPDLEFIYIQRGQAISNSLGRT